MQSAIARLSPKQRDELVGTPEDIVKALDTAISNIEAYRVEMDKLGIDGLDGALTTFRKLHDELEVKKDEAEEYYAGLKFVLSSGAADQRKEKLASNHQRRSLTNKLISGSFGKSFAKLVATRLTTTGSDSKSLNIDTDKSLEDFNPARISVWANTSEVGKEVIKQFEDPACLYQGGVSNSSGADRRSIQTPVGASQPSEVNPGLGWMCP